MIEPEQKNWAILAHLSGLAVLLGIPFGNLIGPFAVYLMKKDVMPFAREHAREALNFQLSLTLYYIISFCLTVVLVGFVLLAVLAVLNIICCIVAAIKASNGEAFRYPLSLRFVG